MCGNHRQVDVAGLTLGVVHALRRLHVIFGARKKNVGHKRLRITVIQREPTGLNLHHDPVTRQKNVIRRGQSEFVSER